MKFEDVKDLLAESGLLGADAETAFRSWQINPAGSDGRRVQRVLEHRGLA